MEFASRIIFEELDVKSNNNIVISFPNPHAKLADIDFKSRVRHSLGKSHFVQTPHLQYSKEDVNIYAKISQYEILVGVYSNIFPPSFFISYLSSLT